jgi:hypothetical protein
MVAKSTCTMPGFTIGFVVFPSLTQLEFTGPLQVQI